MGKSMRETPTRQALLCLVKCEQMSLAQYIENRSGVFTTPAPETESRWNVCTNKV